MFQENIDDNKGIIYSHHEYLDHFALQSHDPCHNQSFQQSKDSHGIRT